MDRQDPVSFGRQWDASAMLRIEEVASQLRRAIGLEDGLPVTGDVLWEIARFRRVVRIERRSGNLSYLAYLSTCKDGFIVKIRRDVHQNTFSFSLAHEIAHTLFFDISCSPPIRIMPWSRTEERLAESLARALLVPLKMLRGFETNHDPFVMETASSGLNELAMKLGVPMWHLLARCAEVGCWGSRIAIRWERSDRQEMKLAAFAKFPRRGYFVPFGKTAKLHESDPNYYVWQFLRSLSWSSVSASPQFGGLTGNWSVVGGANKKGDCICLYRPEALDDDGGERATSASAE